MAFVSYSTFGNIPPEKRQDLRIYIQALHQRYPKLRGLYHDDNKKYNYTPDQARKFVTKEAQIHGNEKYPAASFLITASYAHAESINVPRGMLLVCMDRESWRYDFDNVISALEGVNKLKAA